MSFKTQEDQAAAIQAAHLEIEKRKTIEAVYGKFPTFLRCEANDRAIIEIINRWAGPDVAPTAELFVLALEENPDAISRMAASPEAKIRARLIEEILSALETGGRAHDAFSLKNEKARLQNFTTAALHARLAELKTKHQLAATPVPVLKALVADARRDTRKFPGYIDLPLTIVPRGEVQAVRCDATYLLNLGRTNYPEYRRMCTIFGTEQITARQQGKS